MCRKSEIFETGFQNIMRALKSARLSRNKEKRNRKSVIPVSLRNFLSDPRPRFA